MYKNFKAGEPNQLIGQRITSPADLAALAQVYRDPRFETFRYVFVDDAGTVLGETAVTSRLPATVTFSNSQAAEQNFVTVAQEGMGKFGAAGYYMMHNHPSGRSLPSTADRRMTRSVASVAPGFRGHTIVDFNEYATINSEGRYRVVEDVTLNGVDYRSSPEVPHGVLGKLVEGPDDVAQVVKALNLGDRAAVILMKADNTVSTVAGMPWDAIAQAKGSKKRQAAVLAAMRRIGREGGAGHTATLVLPPGQGMNGLAWMRNTFALVADSEGKVLASRSRGDSIFENEPMVRAMVNEPGAETPRFAPREGAAFRDGEAVYNRVRDKYLDVLPEDATDADVMDAMSEFDAPMQNLLRALRRDDWLGFDFPSQALDAVLSADRERWDLSPGTKQALGRAVNQYFDGRFIEGTPTPGITARDVQAEVDGIVASWADAPKVNVVQSAADLPPFVAQYAQEAGVEPAGVFWQGEAYMVADNITSREGVRTVLVHEVLGHGGLRALFGDQFNTFAQRVAKDLTGNKHFDKFVKAHDYRLSDPVEAATAADEYLAHIAQRIDEGRATERMRAVWSRVVTAVNELLRSLGMNVKLSNAEMHTLMMTAWQRITGGTVELSPTMVSTLNGSVEVVKPSFLAKGAEAKRALSGFTRATANLKNTGTVLRSVASDVLPYVLKMTSRQDMVRNFGPMFQDGDRNLLAAWLVPTRCSVSSCVHYPRTSATVFTT